MLVLMLQVRKLHSRLRENCILIDVEDTSTRVEEGGKEEGKKRNKGRATQIGWSGFAGSKL